MAHFYVSAQGNRGKTHRLGGKDSGAVTYAASWQGAIRVVLYEREGTDRARVTFERHRSRGTDGLLIYNGPVAGPDCGFESSLALHDLAQEPESDEDVSVLVARARDEFAEADGVEVDDDAKVSRADDGYVWIQAWVRVPAEDRCEHGMFYSGAGACPQCGS